MLGARLEDFCRAKVPLPNLSEEPGWSLVTVAGSLLSNPYASREQVCG